MHRPLLLYLVNLVALKYMKTKRKGNKRKTKRKGGTLRVNRDGSFQGVNNTGRADAYLLNLLGVRVDPRQGIDLLAFYGNPEKKIPGVQRSFRDYYLELDPDGQEGVRNFINFIKDERVNDTLRFLASNPGFLPDSGHINAYAVTSTLKDFINLIDPPLDKSGAVQGTEFSSADKASFKHIYANEFRLLLGPEVKRNVLKEKFLARLSEAPYERDKTEDEKRPEQKPTGAALEEGEIRD